MMSLASIRPESKRDIESRIPHAAVALIEIAAQRQGLQRLAFRSSAGGLAQLQPEAEPDHIGIGCSSFNLHQVPVCVFGMVEEIAHHVAVMAAFILQSVADRSLPKVA